MSTGARLVSAAAGGLQIAGNFSGVPFASAAGTLVSGIADTAQQIVINKRKCDRLSVKATRLVSTLEDQNLEGMELQSAVDEVILTLDSVHKRTRRYAGWNRVKKFIKMGEIEKGLSDCETKLDTAINAFQLNSSLSLARAQRDTMDTIRSNDAGVQDLLFQILNNQEDMKRVQRMQESGDHVAERMMEAGQNGLRQLRERDAGNHGHLQELMIAERRTSSSPPPGPHLPAPALPPPKPQDSERYLQYQRGLFKLHQITGIPPSVKILDGEVTKVGELAVTGGTYSDVWQGQWLGEEKVALKALRNIKASDTKAKRRFEHEIRVWDQLKNPHILSFYGITTDFGQIHIVSPWQEFGNVLEYVQSHPKANRIHLLSGASQGIEYLHQRNIVHGNLKCSNILVTLDGEARICDFGMSAVIEDVTEKSASATLTTAGSARWLAPELIEGSISSPTKAADIYSFSMAILELLTGKHPYAHLKREANVIHSIVEKKMMPPRPKSPEIDMWLTDDLWALMERCWSSDAGHRPPMSVVAEGMKAIEESFRSKAADDAMDTS